MKLQRSPKPAAIWIALIATFSVWLPNLSHAQASNIDPWQELLETAHSLPRLYSLLISRDGNIIQEHYFNGKNAKNIANVKSVSKSIMSALVGIAIEQGTINNIDQTIDTYFPKLVSEKNQSNKITVGNLLSMQSGLETTSSRNYGRWVLSKDWIQFALAQPQYDRPNGRMIYSTGNTHLLSAIVTQTSKKSTLDFARQYLFSQLGTHLAAWPKDPQGIYFGGNDMELTPRQMLAFGELFINDGRFNNKQIISKQWVDLSLNPRVASPRGQGVLGVFGWWIRDSAGYETPYAWGYGGQFILLEPKNNIVVVVTSNSTPGPNRRYHTRAAYRLVEQAVAIAAQTET